MFLMLKGVIVCCLDFSYDHFAEPSANIFEVVTNNGFLLRHSGLSKRKASLVLDNRTCVSIALAISASADRSLLLML